VLPRQFTSSTPIPWLVQYCVESESVLDADDVGPPWLFTSTGAFSASGAANSGENGG
jgi:hypothetical protein